MTTTPATPAEPQTGQQTSDGVEGCTWPDGPCVRGTDHTAARTERPVTPQQCEPGLGCHK